MKMSMPSNGKQSIVTEHKMLCNKDKNRFSSGAMVQPNQWSQLSCMFHPTNMIHNFCKNVNCLLPMCASCIGMHSDEHREDSTYGEYVNIHEVINQIAQEIKKACLHLEEYSEEYTHDYQNKLTIAEQCKTNLQSWKMQSIRAFQESIQHYEQTLLSQIDLFQDILYHQYQHLEKQIQYLYSTLKIDLTNLENPQKTLKQVILFYSDHQSHKIKNWQDKFTSKIQILKKQSIKIEIHQQPFPREIENSVVLTEFQDQSNQYLLANKGLLLNSDRKTEIDKKKFSKNEII